jgi:hypothetical protein
MWDSMLPNPHQSQSKNESRKNRGAPHLEEIWVWWVPHISYLRCGIQINPTHHITKVKKKWVPHISILRCGFAGC